MADRAAARGPSGAGGSSVAWGYDRRLPALSCTATPSCVPAALRPVARLIAAILLPQIVLAPAHCLAMVTAPAGLETVLCSPDGARTVHVGPDGQALPAPENQPGFCLGCCAVPGAALPPAPVLAEPAWTGTALSWFATPDHRVPQAARGPPFASRAPPAFT